MLRATQRAPSEQGAAVRVARDTRHEVHDPSPWPKVHPSHLPTFVDLGLIDAHTGEDLCGAPIVALADGSEHVCDLPAGHLTRDGEPSAHAWGTR